MDKGTISISTNELKKWVDREGRYHRDGGPAIEWFDGENHWYKHGKRHRLDGPATVYPNGDKYWYVDGRYHREDGPAVIYANGGGAKWWINNVSFESKEEYFDTLSDEAKTKCLFSEDFLNG
jgi:hypothetical protein